jgi:hypothetical protein
MKPDDTETKIESPKAVSEPQAWKPGSLLLGLILILLGVLFLLQNANMLHLELDRIWQLWPLFIVAIGLSMLSVRGWLASSLTALFIVGALALAALVAFGVVTPGPERATTTKTVEIDRKSIAANESAKDANITIKDGAGNITIRSSSAVPLVKASLESNFMNLTQSSRTSNGTQSVELAVENSGGRWWRGDLKNDLTVTLTESLPLSLTVNSGASNINADLSKVELSNLTLDAGASNLDIKLGNRSSTTDVDLDAGMSNIKFRIPRSAGIRIIMESPMSDLSMPELEKVDEDTYESESYTSAERKINIDGHMGMAKFSIEYY